MKNIVIFFMFTLGLLACKNDSQSDQNQQEGMAQFADDTSFQDKHEIPEEIAYQGKGKMRTLPSTDGQEVNAYVILAEEPFERVLFVFQEWWGLNDHIMQEADRLFDSLGNVTVIAPDMYDGNVATSREDAAAYMKAYTQDRGTTIIHTIMGFSGSRAKIATIGWCFGGGLSLKASTLLGNQAAGCVMYYGMPVQDPAELIPLKADILGIFAEKDKSINGEVVRQFQENAKLVKKNLTVHTYDADHAFANPSSPRYNEAAATEANAVALEFLREKLK